MTASSDPTSVLQALERADDAFAERGRGIPSREDKIENDEHWKTQFTKACRLITAATVLRSQNGYYTARIELCFGATERSIEAYLLRVSNHKPRDFRDHSYCYQRAHEVGLFERDTAGSLRTLYMENRTDSYYGGRQPTEPQAEAMLELARCIHQFVESQCRAGRICICESPE